MSFSEIIAYGNYLPETVLKNEDLKKFVDTSDEWIFSRTGIKQRHIAEKKELTSHLAIKASEDAFNSFIYAWYKMGFFLTRNNKLFFSHVWLVSQGS